MSKEQQESTFGEFTYPTLAVNLYCPECNVPDVHYEPLVGVKDKKSFTLFKFLCHCCKHEWQTEVIHPTEKKKK